MLFLGHGHPDTITDTHITVPYSILFLLYTKVSVHDIPNCVVICPLFEISCT